MIIDQDYECDFLRELLKSPQFGLPEYMDDPIVQRRAGKAIAEASTIFSFHSVIHAPATDR